MKRIMCYIYKVCFSTYFYNQNMDSKKASDIGFAAVRNFVGVIFFMLFIVVSVVFKIIFEYKVRMADNRLLLYPIFLFIILTYINLSKKYMKPMFANIQLDDKFKGNNWPYISIIVFLGLYGGGMFVVARLTGGLFQ